MKEPGTACTDTVHTLFYVSVFEINDLGILTAKLDGNICLWCQLLQRSRNCNNLLGKRNAQMVGKGQTAGTVITGWRVISPYWSKAS